MKSIFWRSFSTKEKVLIIAGPTAVGKTDLAFNLAKRLNGEIISADSVQIYKGMNIGTAKPSKFLRDSIKHHMVDVLSPLEEFTAADWVKCAKECTEDIIKRGKLPIIVGGTGFYLRWFLYGNSSTAPPQSEKAPQLSQQVRIQGWDSSFERLKRIDPEFAATIAKNDIYRLVRGLDVFYSTGKPYSSFKKPHSQELSHDYRCFFLTLPKTELYPRIDIRCETMISMGLIEEVMDLMSNGLLKLESQPGRAVGYRDTINFLEQKKWTREDFLTYLKEFQAASRQLAKRQFHWFREEKIFRWMERRKEEIDLEHIVQTIAIDSVEWHKSEVEQSDHHEEVNYKQTRFHIFENPEAIDEVLDQIKKRLG